MGTREMKLPGKLSLKATSIKYVSTGVAALGLLAFSAQADAADIYAPVGPAPFPVAVPLAPLWSGFYVGAHVGGAWSDLKTTDLDSLWYRDAVIQNFIAGGTPLTTNPQLLGPLHTNQSESGVFGGGTIGYRVANVSVAREHAAKSMSYRLARARRRDFCLRFVYKHESA
jgi:opacity protein-like surface antigen